MCPKDLQCSSYNALIKVLQQIIARVIIQQNWIFSLHMYFSLSLDHAHQLIQVLAILHGFIMINVVLFLSALIFSSIGLTLKKYVGTLIRLPF